MEAYKSLAGQFDKTYGKGTAAAILKPKKPKPKKKPPPPKKKGRSLDDEAFAPTPSLPHQTTKPTLTGI